jgi:DNA-binding transcriptional LysR family regulator
MTFLNIEYFLIIVEEGNISAAARRLFVSQQSLSEHIKKLESEIGTPLLKRSHTISLTPAGYRFVKAARKMVTIYNDMHRDIAILTEQDQKELAIGIATFEAPVFLSELLAEFRQRYPQYETTVVKRRPRDIMHNMKGLDLYFSFLPLNDQLEHIPILENEDDTYAVCARQSLFEKTFGDSWFYIEQKLIETGDLLLLETLPFLILRDRQGIIAQDHKVLFKKAGFTPVVGFQSDSGDLNTSMCIRGIGASLAPMDLSKRKYAIYLEETVDPLKLYSVSSYGLIVRLVLSHKKGKKLSIAEKRFVETTKEFLNKP